LEITPVRKIIVLDAVWAYSSSNEGFNEGKKSLGAGAAAISG